MSGLKHTLVIRPGALGDSVLTLPALHALRLAGAENLLVLGTTASWGFARQDHNGLRIRDFASSEWLGLFSEGAPFGECARAALSRIQSAVVYLSGDTSSAERALKAHGVQRVLTIPPPQAVARDVTAPHASRQLTGALSPWISAETIERAHALALALQDAQHDCFIQLDEVEKHRALYGIGLDAVPSSGFVAIHPGSGGVKKCWPPQRFARLAVELACHDGVVPLVFFGPADAATREAFEAAMPPGVEWQPVDSRPLREVLALLSLSRGYIGNDSGLSHLAARVCPTLAIFGPSNRDVWCPVGSRVRIVQAPDGQLERLSVDAVQDAWAELAALNA